MFNRFFNSQTKTVTFAALLLGSSAFVSRLLGLFRDRLLAGTFGAGQDLDVYFAAFRIPDFVYGILIMGGVTAVFLPVFTEYFKKSEKEAWEFTNNVLNCFLILLVSFCAILAVFTPWLIKFITPGFTAEQKELVVSLTRIMFLSPIFLGISSIFAGILHYFSRFLAYSLAPIFYNLGLIVGILFFVPLFGVWGLAYGVVLGTFAHFFIQIPAAKISGFKYSFTFNFKYPGLIKVFKLMAPRTIGTAAYHLNLIVITAIASTLSVGSIAIFNFANHLQYFPMGIVGISFALASFPVLSRAWVNGQKEEFLDNFSLVLRQTFFLIIPISLLMFLLRTQIVRLILSTGNFGWLESELTAASLGLFCFGMFAIALIPFMARVFYSFQNTKIPVLAGISAMALNVGLAFLFVWLFSFENFFKSFLANFLKVQEIGNIKVLGLSLALTLSGVFQFSLLLLFLRKKLGHIRLKETWRSFQKIVLASALAGAFAYLVLRLVSGLLPQTVLAGSLGALTYLAVAYLLRIPEAGKIKFLIKR